MKKAFSQFYQRTIQSQPINTELRDHYKQQLFHPKLRSWNLFNHIINTMKQSTLFRVTSGVSVIALIVTGVLVYDRPVTAEEIMQYAFAQEELQNDEIHRITRTTIDMDTNTVLAKDTTEYDAAGNYWNESSEPNGTTIFSQLGLASGEEYELYYYDVGDDGIYHDVLPAEGELNTFAQVNADVRRYSWLYSWFLQDESLQNGLYFEPELRKEREYINGREAFVIELTTDYDKTTAWVATDNYQLLQESTEPILSENDVQDMLNVSSVSGTIDEKQTQEHIDDYVANVMQSKKYVYDEEIVKGNFMTLSEWSSVNGLEDAPVKEKSYVQSVEEKAIFFSTK